MKILFLWCFTWTLSFLAPTENRTPLPTDIYTTLDADYVNFTLRNTTTKSIPLWIPSVMNPNLSPLSNSGVTLKIGQKILFKYRGKKRILLVATADLKGQTLDVGKLLKERKKEVDAKRK